MGHRTDETNLPYSRAFEDQENHKVQENALIDPDQWRFTPSILDTNSFSFASFANQQAGDFAPASTGMTNAIFHSQAGDLHTPGMAFQLGTPLSSDDSHPTSAIDMHGFHPHLLHSQPFQTTETIPQQQSYAPSSFLHRDASYNTKENTNDSLDRKHKTEEEAHDMSRYAQYQEKAFTGMPAPQVPSIQKLRFQVTLNAPTAMIKHANEIPITYLNKGQAYAISISDTMGQVPSPAPIKYRTVIRISFEDEQQRQRPSACWQLWKEGRGLAEAHQRGGRLQAVEYVDPNQSGDAESRGSRVELDMASFDSFVVSWSPSPGSATADCSVAVRFNFLSTDFSHSKGVKGIPVRLCAKTEIISSGTPDSPPTPTAEVCFCKVKLFRDHGAERKLSNDITHIKKTIDKLKQQITQIENGVKDVGKRKRSGSMSKGSSHRPGKVQKHKRAWSVSSQGSGGRPAIEDDLHLKLTTMQDMFSSTRPVSVLHLKGYQEDDPDAFPVALPGEPTDLTNLAAIDRRTSWESKQSGESTPTNAVSPTPTSRSDPRPQEHPIIQQATALDPGSQVQNDWEHFTHFATPNFTFDASVKVPKNNADNPPNWIDAFGVDPLYKAPPERPIKPIACFYVLIKTSGNEPENDYYKAVYLMERTVRDLIRSISTKCSVESTHVTRTIRINSKGLKILVDDEVVRELPEGQDMVVEFAGIESGPTSKQESCDGDATPKASEMPKESQWRRSLEMRLLF
ncbi:MAG: hypothetical protein Q9217_003887 [Psora testacea]